MIRFRPTVPKLRELLNKFTGLDQANEAAARYHRMLVELSSDAILVADMDGHLIETNGTACRMLGMTRDELAAASMGELLHPDEQSRFAQLREKVLKGFSELSEWRLRRPSGNYFLAEVNTRALPEGLWYWSLRDVSERNQARIHAESLLAISSALANVRSRQEVGSVIVEQTRQLSEAYAASVWLLDPLTQDFEVLSSAGHSEKLMAAWRRFPITESVPLSQAVKSLQPLFYESREELVNKYPVLFKDPAFVGVGAVAALPLIVDGKAIGGIGLSFHSERRFSLTVQAFLRTVAHHCAIALEKVRLFEAEREAREATEAERQRLAEFFMQAATAITVFKGPDLRLEFINESAKSLFGLSASSLGRPITELRTFPESQAKFDRLKAAFRDGKGFVASEITVLTQNGPTVERRTIDIHVQPTYDRDGRTDGLITQAIDVSDKVTARENIRNQHKWLEKILNSMPTPIVLFEKSTLKLLFMNAAADTITGGFPAWAGRTANGAFFTDARGVKLPLHEWPRFRAAQGETLEGLELVWHVPGTPPVPMLIHSCAIPGLFGHPETIVIVFQEISELKRTERELRVAMQKAEEANRAKSEFLANMSHEIRTPLSAILGFAELMKDPMLPLNERLSYAEVINRNGRQLSSIVNDVLDLSKVEAGKFEVERIPMSLSNVIAQVSSLFRGEVERKGLHLRVEPPPAKVPERICSDPTRIQQILTNLISNAVKFTHRGGIKVSIEAIDSGHGLQIGFRVKDTGIGVPLQKQQSLFQPFSQGDTSMTRKYGGTGLGLALSKRLADLLGGDLILVESREGKGSTFLATVNANLDDLPLTQERPTIQRAVPAPRRERALEGKRILLAEDSPDNQMLIQFYLESEGAHVDLAHHGGEAVEKASHGDYNLILMDIQMPVMDGYSATRSLRSEGYQRPIIALTAHAMHEERARSLREGCNEHLTKPIDRKLLIRTIKGYLEPEPSASPLH
ncbi:MAG: ATP-binding protein [Bdellovibrionales bacterium]